jgi:hypothetical protein
MMNIGRLTLVVGAVWLAGAAWGQNDRQAPTSAPSLATEVVSGNRYFTYPGIELWDPAHWSEGTTKLGPIVTSILERHVVGMGEYRVKRKYQGIRDFVGHPDYNWKSESIADPDVVGPLVRAGLRVDIREGGGFAIYVAPERVLADRQHPVPMVVVPCVVEDRNVFWAMNTLMHFHSYNDLLARRRDFILVYVVSDKSTHDASPFGVIDTATDVYGGDYHRLYLDVTTVADRASINDAGVIEHLGFISVLNVAGKWQSKPIMAVGVARPRSDVRYDPQLVVHGMLGEHWMEGIRFLHDHGKDNDPAIKAHFDSMGLIFNEHDYHGERWAMFSPKEALELRGKLPLVLILSEINHYDEYAIGSAYAGYLDYFKLAAAGKLNILIFARETPESMDVAYDIIKEAERSYPIDPSRIYVTGHSHNGHLAREFAYRHPDMVAAVAPLGNSSGLAAPAYSHEAVVADDARIAAWSRIDMPVVTIGAASEVTSPHTMPSSILNDYDLFMEAWQRRLAASRAPMKTRQEIMAAEGSADPVTRLFGLPNDGSDIQYMDGVAHYTIDVRNREGRKHLRIVGVDNMVHAPEPTMPMIAWEFMSRFARDQRTGTVIELY